MAALEAEATRFSYLAYAPNTHRSYATHRRSYLAFCHVMGYSPVPATTQTLCHYVTLLARSIKFTSVKQYLNIIRILHQEWGLPNPLDNNYQLQCVLRGIRRSLGDSPSRKAPITPEMLKNFLSKLNLQRLDDCALWAAMLLMLYGMLRVASVLCNSHQCDHSRHLRMEDIKWHAHGVNITIRHTKTIQFRERALEIPLPRVPNNIMCPTQALALYVKRSQGIPAQGPVFLIADGPSPVPLTAREFSRRIKNLVAQVGLPVGRYAGHSFRRGGASLAYRLAVPVDTIRVIGDWASSAYMAYVIPERPLVAKAVESMVHGAGRS